MISSYLIVDWKKYKVKFLIKIAKFFDVQAISFSCFKIEGFWRVQRENISID